MPTLEVYKASAGSGKTYQLAYKYISLLLGERVGQNDRIRLYTHSERCLHREILAITFTNKATEEMKQRIIKELFLLADEKALSNYRKDLLRASGATPAQLSKAAREALTSLLFDFGGMQVSTIDAFFQKILRSFAYEADLSGNYELMVDNKQMIDMAIADTLTMVCGMHGSTPYDRRHIRRVRKWVEALLDTRIEDSQEIRIFDKDSSMRRDLAQFINDLSNEDYQAKSRQINEFFAKSDAIDNLTSALNEKLTSLADQIAREAAAVIAADTEAAFTKNSNEMLGRVSRKEFSRLSKTFLEYVSGERSSFAKMFLTSREHSLDVEDKLAVLMADLRLYCTVELMKTQMFNMGIFHEVLEVANKMKVHLNTIMLSDTNTLLNDIIAGSDTPFIYERTGQRLHNFLIDEFQDTSMLQWQNLHPLITNSLGSGYDNMIIGDVKQCIYRFRNSYPALLDTELQADAELADAIRLPSMSVNWRSARDVVEFNSSLFEAIGRKYSLGAYHTVRQQACQSAGKGFVSVSVNTNFPQAAFDNMILDMRRQLDSGYTPGDIVVLVRTNRQGADVVNLLLEESRPGGRLEGVEMLSNESLFVSSAKSVQYIISRLRDLDRIRREKSDIPVSSRTGLPRTTDRELDWLQESLEQLCSEGKSAGESLEAILKRFDDRNHLIAADGDEDALWRQRTRGRSVFEIVEELVTTLPHAEWRETEAKYISAFQDLVIDYCRRGAPSVHGFLALWDEKLNDKAAVGLAEGINAIRVLTIHKSKGLEFPCVHVPLLSGDMNVEDGHRWYDSEEVFNQLGLKSPAPAFFPLKSSSALNNTLFRFQYEALKEAQFLDELNALYVAFTRARNELIVSAKASSANRLSAATVLKQALNAMGAEISGDSWRYDYGEPTVKEPQKAAASASADCNLMSLARYRVCDRLDMWHSTRPAEETDDGELL